MDDYYTGKRLSYEGALCTVRYIGPVEGTKGDWLGVEWDDTSRGKHAGEHQGKVYFHCISKSPTAASFVRPTRPHDKPRTFVEALKFKYAPELLAKPGQQVKNDDTPVEISGKVAEEIGFDKVWRQLGVLDTLKIVILSDLCLRSISEDLSPKAIKEAQAEVSKTCPRIQELDIGWSLLEDWDDVADICRPLKQLKILRISGTRFKEQPYYPRRFPKGTPFRNVQELYLDETLVAWRDLPTILHTEAFPNLKLISLSGNEFTVAGLGGDYSHPGIERIILERNQIEILEDIFLFDSFPNMTSLSLQMNKIKEARKVSKRTDRYLSKSLTTLNVSRNSIEKWEFVDELPFAFPNLSSLRISNNPLYLKPSIASPTNLTTATTKSIEETLYMLTLARIGNLTTLNYSNITPQDRLNGELYYLSIVEKEYLAESVKSKPPSAQELAERHPRYYELCREYDRDPVDVKQIAHRESQATTSGEIIDPASLEARVVTFTFKSMIDSNNDESKTTKDLSESTPLKLELLKTFSTYSLKGMLSRKLSLQPLGFRLIYESEELDPVTESFGDQPGESGLDGEVDWDIDPPAQGLAATSGNTASVDSSNTSSAPKAVIEREGRRWKKREVEMLDSTRDIGSWLDDGAKQATVRIEPLI